MLGSGSGSGLATVSVTVLVPGSGSESGSESGYRRPPTVIELQPDYFIFKILKIRCLAHNPLIALADISAVAARRHVNPIDPWWGWLAVPARATAVPLGRATALYE